jgi:hypothetical protein
MLTFVEVAVIVPYQYMQTDVVLGDTTLFKEHIHEETRMMRFLCLQESRNNWRCGKCGRCLINLDSKQCPVCRRPVQTTCINR